MVRSFARMAGVIALTGCLIAGGSSAFAYEPAEAFVKALRDAQYYDTAIDYLDAIKDNPAVPGQFKSRLLYERGITLIEGATSVKDPVIRDKWLDDGQKTMSEYLATDKDGPLALSAQTSLGYVIFNRGAGRIEKAKKAKPEAKEALVTEGRAMLQEAGKTFEKITDDVRERLKSLPATIDEKQDPKRFEERERLRSDYLRARILVAQSDEYLGESYPASDPNYKKFLESGAQRFKSLYDDNRNRPAGMIARVGQGRCAQKLGQHEQAVGYFDEVVTEPDFTSTPDGRRIAVTAMIDMAKSLETLKKNRELFDKLAPLVKDARPDEERSPSFMELRLYVARAAKALADELKAKDPKSPEIRKLLTEGRSMVQFAARFVGPFQDDARKLMPAFTGGDAEAATGAVKVAAKTFEEAKAAGDEVISQMTDAQLILTANTENLAKQVDAAEKDRLTKEIEAGKKELDGLRESAFAYYSQALNMSGPETEITTVNGIRYLLCYLSYQKQDYYNCIVYGEFIATRFPQQQFARSSAELVMNSYVQLARELSLANKDADRTWENGRITEICKYIVKQWPNEAEASKALGQLIPLMIGEGKLSEAQAYLEQIPASSDQRGVAELKLGQALWRNYVVGMREVKEWEAGTATPPMGVTPAARRKELEATMTSGKKVLDDGVKRMAETNPDSPNMPTAVLSLAQILVDTGEAPRAVTLLEDSKIGPVALSKRNDPVLEGRDGFAAEAYRTALRAYITALPTSKDSDAILKKAEEMMDSLKTLLGDTPEGQKILVANYVSLARDLKTQMELSEGDAKVALGKGFEKFLERVSGEANEPQILNWVAETYRGMADSFAGNDKKAGLVYYGKAADVYKSLLDKAKANPNFLGNPKMVTQIQFQQALTLRGQLKYKEAVDAFEAILSATPNILMVQIEATKTYQMWGDLGQVDRYRDAMVGARERKGDVKGGKKFVIWGWGEIGKMAAGTGKNKEELHEARYNYALCHYKYAAKNPATKQETIKAAKKDIVLTIGFYGDGGANWRPKYDDLLKKIQKDLGEPQNGLEAIPPKGSPAAKGTPSAGAAAPAGAAVPAKPVVPVVPGGVVPAVPVPGGKAPVPAASK